MADKRVRLLLGAAAALAALRLVGVPWLAAQTEAHERLQVQTQRLDRSVGVVQNRESITAAEQSLELAVAQAREIFPAAAGEQFRLDSQQRIGELVTQAGLQLALFDWILEGKLAEGGLAYGRARMQVTGGLSDVARLHGELEGTLPFLAVREAQLNLMGPAAAFNDTGASLTIVADLFYRPEEAR